MVVSEPVRDITGFPATIESFRFQDEDDYDYEISFSQY